jgi:NTE family protein
MRNEAQFGDVMRLSTEFYQPIDPLGWFFVLPRAYFERSDVDVFVRQNRVARFDLEQSVAAFEAGVNLGRDVQLRGGIGYLDAEARLKIGDPLLYQSEKVHGGIYQATFEYDNLDDPSFPNYGAFAVVNLQMLREELGFDDSFEELTSGGAIYHTWWGNTLGLGFRYSSAIGGRGTVERLNSVGGFLRLSGFDRGSISGRHAGVGQVIAYRRIASPAIFAWEFPVYVGGAFEAGNAWQHRSDIEDDLLLSVAPFFGVETPLGPLYVAYAYGEGGHHQGYLFLGQSF